MSAWAKCTPAAIAEQLDICLMAAHALSGPLVLSILWYSTLDYKIFRGYVGGFILTMAFLDMYRYNIFSANVLLAAQILQKLSHGIAYTIITTRTVAICRNVIASWLMGTTHIALWAVLMTSIGLLQPAYIVIHPATDNTVHSGKWKAPLEEVMLSGTLVGLTVIFLISAFWGLMNHRTRSGSDTARCPWHRTLLLLKMFYDEGLHYFVGFYEDRGRY
ncbi:hypothetical protein EW026_g3073 [Hermanssonia centrifuga]|uniref:Uncharacterized protein n=1 Tax=Hermanssonia centrifuga TaxID=98765 RepID=A0A4S4KME2_9APHY|nr:hypothetical protein EW026_g3073 [Hermanssonia centrifuga]